MTSAGVPDPLRHSVGTRNILKAGTLSQRCRIEPISALVRRPPIGVVHHDQAADLMPHDVVDLHGHRRDSTPEPPGTEGKLATVQELGGCGGLVLTTEAKQQAIEAKQLA